MLPPSWAREMTHTHPSPCQLRDKLQTVRTTSLVTSHPAIHRPVTRLALDYGCGTAWTAATLGRKAELQAPRDHRGAKQTPPHPHGQGRHSPHLPDAVWSADTWTHSLRSRCGAPSASLRPVSPAQCGPERERRPSLEPLRTATSQPPCSWPGGRTRPPLTGAPGRPPPVSLLPPRHPGCHRVGTDA